MLSESQNIEYKESWRDEYLKWICGFANAHGGRIYIGVNNNKEVIGLPDAKKTDGGHSEQDCQLPWHC